MMSKTVSLLRAAFWLLIGCCISQVICGSYELKYKPVIFDDQYIGCSEDLSDTIMPGILTKEKSNPQFNFAWKNATKRWREIKSDLDLPQEFEDEHGIALLVFTSKYPEDNPIHQQLNGNLTIAGASRKAYMDKFHFKALHYYLTRALQILKPDCDITITTYRGSRDTFKVPPVFRFGRFTSSSLSLVKALQFGRVTSFYITSCFGARISRFSFFPHEHEVLIPATEMFTYVKKEDSDYYLESTGQTCSYFNCAILGGERKNDAICLPGGKSKVSSTSTSLQEQEERIAVLEELIVKHHDQWDLYIPYINLNYQNMKKELSNTLIFRRDINSLNETITALNITIPETKMRVGAMENTIERVSTQVTHVHSTLTYHLELMRVISEKMRYLEAFRESVSEAQRSIDLMEYVLQTDRTRATDVHRTLSHSVDLLQEKVRNLEAFIGRLEIIYWIVVFGFTLTAGIGVYFLLQKLTLGSRHVANIHYNQRRRRKVSPSGYQTF